ncbi:MAG TPA: flagellar biosynthetic protein FliO [Candidatus Nitrosotalea sp.]|nr:flagellar biosynthetic protein FliO [Candidatus Nitrosotalea sp.]
MAASFWTNYLEKLAILAVILSALYLLARRLREGRLPRKGARRLYVLDSAMLSPHASIHVVRAGERCFLIGSTAGGVTALAELSPSEDVS